MKKEEHNQIPFLDGLAKEKTDGKLVHSLYRKKNDTNRYFKAASHHHPAQINAVAGTLLMRSRALSDEEHRDRKMDQIKKSHWVPYQTQCVRSNEPKKQQPQQQQQQQRIPMWMG